MENILDVLEFSAIARSAIPNCPLCIGQDDLEQEARIFALEIAMSKPDMKPGWYARACIFHLRDLVRREKRRMDPKAATEKYLALRAEWNQFSEKQRRVLYNQIVKSKGETRRIMDLFLDGLSQLEISYKVQKSQMHVSRVIETFVSRTRVILKQ